MLFDIIVDYMGCYFNGRYDATGDLINDEQIADSSTVFVDGLRMAPSYCRAHCESKAVRFLLNYILTSISLLT